MYCRPTSRMHWEIPLVHEGGWESHPMVDVLASHVEVSEGTHLVSNSSQCFHHHIYIKLPLPVCSEPAQFEPIHVLLCWLHSILWCSHFNSHTISSISYPHIKSLVRPVPTPSSWSSCPTWSGKGCTSTLSGNTISTNFPFCRTLNKFVGSMMKLQRACDLSYRWMGPFLQATHFEAMERVLGRTQEDCLSNEERLIMCHHCHPHENQQFPNIPWDVIQKTGSPLPWCSEFFSKPAMNGVIAWHRNFMRFLERVPTRRGVLLGKSWENHGKSDPKKGRLSSLQKASK